MKRTLEVIGGLGDLLTLLLLVVFVGIAPFVWIYRLAKAELLIYAGFVFFFWLLSAGAVVVAIRRKWPASIPLGIFLTWLVILTFVFSDSIAKVF
jgi:hypothetical protein